MKGILKLYADIYPLNALIYQDLVIETIIWFDDRSKLNE